MKPERNKMTRIQDSKGMATGLRRNRSKDWKGKIRSCHQSGPSFGMEKKYAKEGIFGEKAAVDLKLGPKKLYALTVRDAATG